MENEQGKVIKKGRGKTEEEQEPSRREYEIQGDSNPTTPGSVKDSNTTSQNSASSAQTAGGVTNVRSSEEEDSDEVGGVKGRTHQQHEDGNVS